MCTQTPYVKVLYSFGCRSTFLSILTTCIYTLMGNIQLSVEIDIMWGFV